MEQIFFKSFFNFFSFTYYLMLVIPIHILEFIPKSQTDY